jgi:hypothetical protein
MCDTLHRNNNCAVAFTISICPPSTFNTGEYVFETEDDEDSENELPELNEDSEDELLELVEHED